MFQLFRKYKVSFAAGILCFYLFGGLQLPLLECLHFVSHFGNMAGGKYQKHDLSTHNNLHSHAALKVIDELTSYGTDENLPVHESNKIELSKVFQLFSPSEILSVYDDFQKINTYYLIVGILEIDSRVPTPPPQV